jgi:putative tricarboxylic transport membrane protein
MDLIANLATGFGAAVTPLNLGFCLFGCLIGTLIGVLPGIGPIATIAMLLPVTFGLSPLGALIMLAGIYPGRSTAARPRRSWSICRASRRRW